MLEVVQQKAVADDQGYKLVLFADFGLHQMQSTLLSHSSLCEVVITKMLWVQVCPCCSAALCICF